MRISEAIDRITSEEYTYELSAFNKKREEQKVEEAKREALRRDEEARKKVVSNEDVVITNLPRRS